MLRSRWSFIIAVFVGGLLAAAQFGKIALTLPEVAAAFGRTIPEVSLLVSLVGVMGLMLGVVAGALAAGLGAGRTYLLGLVLGAALSLLQALMPPFAIFASLRVLEGIAHLALVVAGPPLMAAAASDRARPFVMGLWAVFFGASLVISAQLFPPLLRVGGLPLIFASHGAALALLAAILWPMVPKGPRNAVPLDPIAMHRSIYGNLRLVAPGLGFVCYTLTFVACVALLPPALDRPDLATTLPLVTLVTTLLGGALCRRWACHWVAGLGYGGVVVFVFAAWAGLPFALEVAFAFMGLVPGASFAAIPALNPGAADRTRATGAIAQLGNLGTVTGTPLLAAIWAGAGVDALLLSIVAFAVLGGVLAIWSGHRAAGEQT